MSAKYRARISADSISSRRGYLGFAEHRGLHFRGMLAWNIMNVSIVNVIAEMPRTGFDAALALGTRRSWGGFSAERGQQTARPGYLDRCKHPILAGPVRAVVPEVMS